MDGNEMNGALQRKHLQYAKEVNKILGNKL
jgi:hypothetical protein